MLRWFPRLRVATACSLPDVNFLDPYFIFIYMHYNNCHRAVKYIIIIMMMMMMIIIIIIIIYLTANGHYNNCHREVKYIIIIIIIIMIIIIIYLTANGLSLGGSCYNACI